ncbi:hypothetical protein TSTA_076600 [Talaromyces stipitatus ATCC 10500]|uniref:GPI anchored protein n=1 Tax=Talaromyces stipitatus (strain ATCC 10500 / CBS 375.48 / QM 6759 / NRRL 1006) TaxID=441959 RepID=B8LWI3_TALSN|nr:uncharacterized protein TSTA_076600 [Talaromyces stipitatus ATCC 10500]EED24294.1 hypothetical protein TSTA_076600 [Talaromyces stipitatus ATCC 10500]
MKQSILSLATLFISSSWCLEPELAPFTHPATAASTALPEFAHDFEFFKRDGNCPANYNTCSNEGNSGICCRSGTTCTVDGANNYACCPTGAKCTGTLGATATGGNGNSGSATTSGFMFPQGTTSTTASRATITGSTIPGAAFPFVYIPTTFSNAASCNEYSSCIASLGGQYGVTIVGGGGGGVTVQGNTAAPSASAAVSTCSSLSRQACYGLQESYCTAFGTSGGTTTGGQFVAGNYAPTRKSSLHEILLAAAAGVVGMFI